MEEKLEHPAQIKTPQEEPTSLADQIKQLVNHPNMAQLSPYERIAETFSIVNNADMDRGVKRAGRQALHELAYEEFKKGAHYQSLEPNLKSSIDKGSVYYDAYMRSGRAKGTDDYDFFEAMNEHMNSRGLEDFKSGMLETSARLGWTALKLASDLVGLGVAGSGTVANMGLQKLVGNPNATYGNFPKYFAQNWKDFQSNFISSWIEKKYLSHTTEDPMFARIIDGIMTDLSLSVIPGMQAVSRLKTAGKVAAGIGHVVKPVSFLQKAEIYGKSALANVAVGQATLASIDATVQGMAKAGYSEDAQLTVSILGALGVGTAAGIYAANKLTKGSVEKFGKQNIGPIKLENVPEELRGAYSYDPKAASSSIDALERILANPLLLPESKAFIQQIVDHYKGTGYLNNIASSLYKLKNDLPLTPAEQAALRSSPESYMNEAGLATLQNTRKNPGTSPNFEYTGQTIDPISTPNRIGRTFRPGARGNILKRKTAERTFLARLKENLDPKNLKDEVNAALQRIEKAEAEAALAKKRRGTDVSHTLTGSHAEATTTRYRRLYLKNRQKGREGKVEGKPEEVAPRKPAKNWADEYTRNPLSSRPPYEPSTAPRYETDYQATLTRMNAEEAAREGQVPEGALLLDDVARTEEHINQIEYLLAREQQTRLDTEIAREEASLESAVQQLEAEIENAIPTQAQSMREAADAIRAGDGDAAGAAATAYTDMIGKQKAIEELRREAETATDPQVKADIEETLKDLESMPEAKPSQKTPEPANMEELPLTAQLKAAEIIETMRQGKEALLGRPLTNAEYAEIRDTVLSYPDSWNGRLFNPNEKLLASVDGSIVNAGYIEAKYPMVAQAMANARPESRVTQVFRVEDFLSFQNGLIARLGPYADDATFEGAKPLLNECFTLWDEIKAALGERRVKDSHGRLTRFKPQLEEGAKDVQTPNNLLKKLYEIKDKFAWTNKNRGSKVLKSLMDALPGFNFVVAFSDKMISSRAMGLTDYINRVIYLAPGDLVKPTFLHELGHVYFMYGLDAAQKMEWMVGMRRSVGSAAEWDRAFPGAAQRRAMIEQLDPNSAQYAYQVSWLNDPSEMFASQVAAYMHDGIVGSPEIMGMLSKAVNGIKQFFISGEVAPLLKGSPEAEKMISKFMLMPDPEGANRVSIDVIDNSLRTDPNLLPIEEALSFVDQIAAATKGKAPLSDPVAMTDYIKALAYDRLYGLGKMQIPEKATLSDLIDFVDRAYNNPQTLKMIDEAAYAFLKKVQASKGDIKVLTEDFINQVSAAHAFANLPEMIGKTPNRSWLSWASMVGIRAVTLAYSGFEPDPTSDFTMPFVGRVRWNYEKFLTSPFTWLAMPGAGYALKYLKGNLIKGKGKLTDYAEKNCPLLARTIETIDDSFTWLFDPRQGLSPALYNLKRTADLNTKSDLHTTALWAESLMERYTPEQLKAMSRYYDGFLTDAALERAAKSGPKPTTLRDLQEAVDITKRITNLRLENLLDYSGDSSVFRLGRFYKSNPVTRIFKVITGLDYIPKVRLRHLSDNFMRKKLSGYRAAEIDEFCLADDGLGRPAQVGDRLNGYINLDEPFRRNNITYVPADTKLDIKYSKDPSYQPLYTWKDNPKTFGYIRQGYKIEAIEGDKITVSRAYSAQERKAYGEIEDLSLRVAATAEKMKRELLVANFVKSIKNKSEFVRRSGPAPTDGEWVKMPEGTDPKTGANIYGPLAGAFVKKEVAKALRSLQSPKFSDFFAGDSKSIKTLLNGYSWALSHWKMTRTVLNPVSHFNNFCSNVVMGSLLGHNVLGEFAEGRNLYRLFLQDAKAQKLLLQGKASEYRQLIDQIKKDPDYQYLLEAQEFGMGQSTRVEHEIMYKTSFVGRLAAMQERKAKGIVDPKKGFLYNAAKATIDKMQKAYEFEDLVFKFGAFKRARKQGLDPDKAADYAFEAYFDYGQLSKGAEFLRDSGIVPFISYIYKSFPAIIKGMIEKPERFLFCAGLLEMLNMWGLSAEYGSEDLMRTRDAADRLTPSYLRDYSMAGLFRNTINLGHGGKVLNVQRLMPFGDYFKERANPDDDSGNAFSFQFIRGLFLSNPMMDILTTGLTNKDAGLNKALVPERNNMNHPLTQDRLLAAKMHKLWNTVVPNLFFIPGTYNWNSMMNALVAKGILDPGARTLGFIGKGYTGMDYAGNPVSSASVALGNIGIKLHQYDFQSSALKEMHYIQGDVSKEAAYVKARLKNPTVSQEDRKADLAKLVELRQEAAYKVKAISDDMNWLKRLKKREEARKARSTGTALPASGS